MADRLLLTILIAALGVVAFLAFRSLQMRRASRAAAPAGKPAILYFRSETCAPCRAQARFLQQVQREWGDRIVIEKVDADMEQAKAEQFGVFTVPTTLIVDERGRVRHANFGLADVRKLSGQLSSLAVP
jgi:thiol-disulfide isomerase/thioredoxin